MTLLPAEAVKAYIDEELPGAQAWADRAGFKLDYDPDQPRLRICLEGPGPASVEKYLLEGRLDDYKTLPPIWHFLDPRTYDDIGAAAFPAAAQPPTGGTSLFIAHDKRPAVICAHFNRWAYAEEQGPHSWDLSNWQNADSSYAVCKTLGDMLERINVEVKASPGRMAELP